MAIHFYTACTLDGFIATTDHSLDWLFAQDFDTSGPMAYPAFMEKIGALVMGASTYEWLRAHEDAWPYAQPSWVFTHRDLQAAPGGDIRIVQGDVREHLAAITASAQGNDVWVMGGGDLAAQFARAGALDELWLQFAPVTLGDGQPLFPLAADFELLEVARNRDFACAHYRVRKGSLAN